MTFTLLLSCTVAFFVLINPVHKILVISTLQDQFTTKQLQFLSLKSSLTAGIILLIFLLLGELIFTYIFRIELYAFQITCGAVLAFNGLSGLQNGVLLKIDKHIALHDLSAVPIAIPMIAGPATITAAVTFPAHFGRFVTIIAIVVALLLNLLCMLYAKNIGKILVKYNFMNALIRITGLIVATIGVQMICNGIINFVHTIHVG